MAIVFQFSFEINCRYEPNSMSDCFLTRFGFQKLAVIDSVKKITYYSFTTLSTVGFGDLFPQNTFERGFISIIMLGGVATFSYIMSIFINTLNVFQDFNKGFNDGDRLIKFFSVLGTKNSSELRADIKEAITNYFEYKWVKDKNLALSSAEDLILLD